MRVREYALEQLHHLIRKDPWVRAVFLAAGGQLDSMAERILDIYYQDDFGQVRGRGLELWERIMGLHPDPDATDEERRKAIRMRMLACRPPSVESIQDICDTWRQDAISHVWPGQLAAGFIELWLYDGVWHDDMDTLLDTLDKHKPAHLAFHYATMLTHRGRAGAYCHIETMTYSFTADIQRGD